MKLTARPSGAAFRFDPARRAGRKVRTEWNELKERLKSPQAGRNALAHRRVITLKIGNAKSQVALVEYNHDIRHLLEEEISVSSHMKIDRVKAPSKEFRGLGIDLMKFANSIEHSEAKQ